MRRCTCQTHQMSVARLAHAISPTPIHVDVEKTVTDGNGPRRAGGRVDC